MKLYLSLFQISVPSSGTKNILVFRTVDVGSYKCKSLEITDYLFPCMNNSSNTYLAQRRGKLQILLQQDFCSD